MPVNSCSDGGKPGYKWGDAGKCYIYTQGSEASKKAAKKKALAQGIAIGDINLKALQKELSKLNESTNSSESNYITNQELDELLKSLKEWFKEDWVDISRPKPGGGFEPCGRADASSGKYPKCVPAARAARMTQAEIDSAVRRKRRAESTQQRQDKKPIYVSTEKAETVNVPTNPSLYARVKAEAKSKFDVYPSAYANAWLVREYKRRGGGYKAMKKDLSKVAEDLPEAEAALADALVSVAERFGPYDAEGTGIWVEYETAEENDEKDIGVHCHNCVLYAGDGVCKILKQQVEHYGKCRFVLIPDGLVSSEMEDETEEEEDGEEEDSMSALISLIRDLLNKEK